MLYLNFTFETFIKHVLKCKDYKSLSYPNLSLTDRYITNLAKTKFKDNFPGL